MADFLSISLKSRYLISSILVCIILQASYTKAIEERASSSSEEPFTECSQGPVVTISDSNIEKGANCDAGSPDLWVEEEWKEIKKIPTCGAVVLKCKSSQPVAWQYHGPGKLSDFHNALKIHTTRTLAGQWNENATRWCYEVIIELNQLSMYSSMAGRYTCGELMAQEQGQSSQNSTFQQLQWKNDSNNASIYFYGELPKASENPVNLEVSPTPSNLYEVVIPCGLDSSIASLKKLNESTSIFDAVLEDHLKIKHYPEVGYHIRENSIKYILGTYTCHDNKTTNWTVKSAQRNTNEFTQSNDISIEYTGGCFKCINNHTPAAQIIACDNPFHCNLLVELAKSDLKPSNLINCPHSNGLAICVGGDKYQIFEFVKLDGKNLARPPMELKFPDHMSNNNIFVNDTVMINCQASKYAFSNGLQLLAEFKNGSKVVANEMVLENSGDTGNINGYYHQEWKVNVTSKDIIKYICIAPRLRSSGWGWNATANVTIIDAIPPIIIESESSPSQVQFYETDVNLTIYCVASEATPEAYITWFKNGRPFSDHYKDPTPSTSNWFPWNNTRARNYSMTFSKGKNIGFDITDLWTCNITNGRGPRAIHRMNVTVISKPDATWWIIGSVIAFVVIICVIFGYAYFKLQKRLHMTTKELETWLHGNENLADDPNILKDGRNLATKLPYQRKYELKPERLIPIPGQTKKKGAFGIVVRMQYTPEDGGTPVDVAVKIPNNEGGAEQFLLGFKASKDELKIFQYIQCLGEHDYVVKLVGAVTNQIEYGKLQVVLEYCEYSLEDFLKEYRTHFYDEIIGEEIVFSGAHHDNVNVAPATGNGVQGYVVLSMRKFTTTDLIMWAYQIACGMKFLTSLKIVHRDLAARNVLLKKTGDFLIAKIADFGISIFPEMTNQPSGHEEVLPWAYMAPELFDDNGLEFCEATDVWAFGITMWELFSLASKKPYHNRRDPGMQGIATVINQIRSGYRNPQPKQANAKIYEIMCDCWALEPSERPTFEQLSERLFQLLPEEYKATIPAYVFKPHKEVTLDDLQPLANAHSSFELEPETNYKSQRSIKTFLRQRFSGVFSWK